MNSKLLRSQPRTTPNNPWGSLIAAALLAVCGISAITFCDRVPEMFSLLALGVSLLMIAGQIVWPTRRRWFKRRPNASWRDDWSWELGKSSDRKLQQIAAGLYGGTAITLFLVPLNTLLLFNPEIPAEGRLFVVPVIGFFDIAVIVSFGYTAYQAFQLWRFGASEVRFSGAPIYLGGNIALRFQGDRRLQLAPAEARLVCVQEKFIRHGSGKAATATLEFDALFEESRQVVSDSFGGFDVSFDLPETAPATAFHTAPAIYWELEVTFKDRPYHAIFLLPIYAREHNRA